MIYLFGALHLQSSNQVIISQQTNQIISPER